MLYGSTKYLECVLPMTLFALTYIPSAYSYLLGDIFLFLTGHERILAFFNFIGGGINVLLNFVLIGLDRFNALTAVATLFIAYTAVGIICYLYIRFQLKIRVTLVDRTILRYFLLSLSFIPIVWLIKLLQFGPLLTSAIAILVCGSLYCGILILVKDSNMQLILNKVFRPVKRLLHKK